MPLIFRQVINFCWFCIKWGLLLGAIGAAVVAFYFHDRVEEEIRCQVVEQIAKHYRGLKVTARSAALVEEGIEIRGLSILDPGAEGPRAELAYYDEICLSCSTNLQELMRGELDIKQITIRRPRLRATRLPDGTWSTAKLFPPPKLSERPPEMTIENGTVEIFDTWNDPAGTLTLRDVNLKLSAPDPASPKPNARTIKGTFSADHLRRVEVEGAFDPYALTWAIRGTIDKLEISPEMCSTLPGPLATKLAMLGGLRGQGSVDFQIEYDPAAESPYRFGLAGRLEQGRIDDARLPHPLREMRATFRASNAGFSIDELVARCGEATLRMSAQQSGFEMGKRPLQLEASIWQLELDRQLLDALPARLQDHWYKYLPAGQVDADLKLRFDGRTWYPQLAVECLNVSFTHHKFPYRLSDGKGSVTLKDDVLEVHLIAYSRSQQVRVDAEMQNATSGPIGWFEAKGQGLELDEKLFNALKDKPRAMVRSLNPRGTIDFSVRTWRDQPNGPLHKYVLIQPKRCSIRYDKFPYPLGNIRGTLVMRDDAWTFHELEGTNDTGRVRCEGHMTPPQQGQALYLRLTATDVPLEEELRDALRPNLQRLWNSIRPRGTVDLEEVVVRYVPGQKRLSVSLRAKPQPESTSIEPVHFPYRMERLQGVLAYHDGNVTLHRFQAEHGPVKITSGGRCSFRTDGSWDLSLEGLTVDRLRLEDRELIQALPGRLKKAIVELKPGGPVGLRGSFGLEGGARVGDPVQSRWDLAVEIHPGGSVDCGIKLENVQGSMTLAGEFNGRNFYSRGELNIDAMTYKDYQFTEVRGPMWIDDRQVLFGSWVARRRNRGSAPNTQQRPRPLTAKLFEGTVACDPWVAFGAQPRYGLHATLSGADLSRLAQEAMVGRQDLKGKIIATLDLGGTGRSLNGLRGHGKIHLRDADVYELPLMIALLKILSIREPDATAFSRSDIVFQVQGSHIYLRQINFNGDAISLLGQGEMDFQQNVALTFHAVVGNDEVRVPVLWELLGGASQQIMQIHVRGTLQDPQTEKVAFPGVNQALQQLQNDLQKGAGSPALFPQALQRTPHDR